MTRLIDADALVYDEIEPDCLVVFKSDIDRQPTIDAVPVRHGKWIVKGQEIFCSVCEEESSYTWHGSSKFSNYCPNCGADMRGEPNAEKE